MSDIQILAKKPVEEMQLEIRRKKNQLGMKQERKGQVKTVFDVSISMGPTDNDFYSTRPDENIMEAIAYRVLAAALTLDNDGKVPVYSFGNRCTRVREDLTVANMEGYVLKHFKEFNQGTEYAPFIRQMMLDAEAGDPTLVIVFTDGNNSDRDAARKALIDASYSPVFYQFIGIYGKRNPGFAFLDEMNNLGGRFMDNAGAKAVSLNGLTDEKLYDIFLSEYSGFHALAQSKGLLDANFKWNGVPAPKPGEQPKQGGGLLGGIFGKRR